MNESAGSNQRIEEYLRDLGWKETNQGFIAENLFVYFNSRFKQWRLRDLSAMRPEDLTSINNPMTEEDKVSFKRICSQFYNSDY